MTITRHSSYGGILHEVVAHNGTLYLSGIVADDLGQDVAGQAEDAMAQLRKLLEANGSDMRHVLQVVVYLAALDDKAAFNDVWKRSFDAGHLPARAAIGVADLGPGVRLEMVVVAAQTRAAAR